MDKEEIDTYEDDENDDGYDYDDYDGANDDYAIDEGELDEDYDCDPERFDYRIFHEDDLAKICDEKAQKVASQLDIKPEEARDLLIKFKWSCHTLIDLYTKDRELFKEKFLLNDKNNNTMTTSHPNSLPEPSSELAKCTRSATELCSICFDAKSDQMDSLEPCGHKFCTDCWRVYFELLINESTCVRQYECMHSSCSLIAPKMFVTKHLKDNEKLIKRYEKLAKWDLIKSCDDLRRCPGADCDFIVWAKPEARRVVCSACCTQFCFMCTAAYHAPNSCATIRKWYSKCQDDSETRNYLLVHTQDCPACKVCIEKNGGCSHMTCNRCKHEFCWVCLNDWKSHGATYDCNRYKGSAAQDQAREALNRYTHYYHRWINHSNSLKFEKAFKEKCESRIQEKIMNGQCGTLVDWEFLMDAAHTLTKARYTLQYTYPFAYFLENNEAKLLFENIQAELEREVENLSHSLEKVNLNDKFNIKTQINIVEKRRKTLIKDFIE